MKRTLRLRSESLTELTATELGGVAGAAEQQLSLSCPVLRCVHSQDCIDTRTLNGCVIVPTTPQNCRTLPC